MIHYSNNGNISSIDLTKQSSVEYIEEAIKNGYKVKCDIRLMSDNNLWLGEIEAKFKMEDEFLYKNSKHLLLQCKNISSLYKIQELEKQIKGLHYFFHATDNAVLTSKKMIVIYPGKRPLSVNSIAFFPEETDYQRGDLIKCSAVCSNSIEFYKKLIENELPN